MGGSRFHSAGPRDVRAREVAIAHRGPRDVCGWSMIEGEGGRSSHPRQSTAPNARRCRLAGYVCVPIPGSQSRSRPNGSRRDERGRRCRRSDGSQRGVVGPPAAAVFFAAKIGPPPTENQDAPASGISRNRAFPGLHLALPVGGTLVGRDQETQKTPLISNALPERRVTVHSGHMGYTIGPFAGSARCPGRCVSPWMSV
jgi:hypothetical protein